MNPTLDDNLKNMKPTQSEHERQDGQDMTDGFDW
jgi:hypothetical protein